MPANGLACRLAERQLRPAPACSLFQHLLLPGLPPTYCRVAPMCGRYALFRWSPVFAALPGFPADQQPQWNIAPGAQILLLRAVAGERQLVRARWGLTPPWLTA